MPYISRKLRRKAFDQFKSEVCPADEDWVKRRISIAVLLELPKPSWIYCEGECFDFDDGLFVMRYDKEPNLGWIATREGAPLITADGRIAVFNRRMDAQNAARVHAKDGKDESQGIRDDLQWQLTVRPGLEWQQPKKTATAA